MSLDCSYGLYALRRSESSSQVSFIAATRA